MFELLTLLLGQLNTGRLFHLTGLSRHLSVLRRRIHGGVGRRANLLRLADRRFGIPSHGRGVDADFTAGSVPLPIGPGYVGERNTPRQAAGGRQVRLLVRSNLAVCLPKFGDDGLLFGGQSTGRNRVRSLVAESFCSIRAVGFATVRDFRMFDAATAGALVRTVRA